ncbi:unnamed protein product [Ambrosiozyma monospora]|uniref:Unnamed protein product n=1 Tax=Ambrosiozyma monospora TaxID=43982 RepID=A0ACB5U456_AMBMO|nr:unnamed protein product [Ambrosiozyma monospora]
MGFKSPLEQYHDYMTKMFEKGEGSDVKIIAFKTIYKLHRLQLSQCQFFSNIFNIKDRDIAIRKDLQTKFTYQKLADVKSGRFKPDSYYTIPIPPENEYHIPINDPLITKKSFELALRRLYFCEIVKEEMKIPFEMFITGSYLGIESIISNSYNHVPNSGYVYSVTKIQQINGMVYQR